MLQSISVGQAYIFMNLHENEPNGILWHPIRVVQVSFPPRILFLLDPQSHSIGWNNITWVLYSAPDICMYVYSIFKCLWSVITIILKRQ